MDKVYVPKSVGQVAELHKDLLANYPGEWSVRFVLDRQAQRLKDAYDQQDPAVNVQLGNWHPECAGLSFDELLTRKLSLDDMRLVVAREHGFDTWKDVLQLGSELLDKQFESSIEALLGGDIEALETLLKKRPELTHLSSKYGHHATLLHYLAANGVETWRQRVPSNAGDIARLLLRYGADIRAKAAVYGGRYTPLELLLTSAHPAVAGVAEDLAEVFRNAEFSN